MKVAVSGATGFIGRHVVAELERLGISPVLWVRDRSEVPSAWSRHRLVRIDILNPPPHAFDLLGRPDVLIHLAWGGLPNYMSLHHFEQELPAQYALLKALVCDGLGSMLVSGTCFEYGQQCGALTETFPTLPTNPYGLAKDVLRQQLAFLQCEFPFALTWARLFYLHGDGQSPKALMPQLRRAVAASDALFPMSGGEQLRDYLEVCDAAAHLVKLASMRANLGTINVCSGKAISVRRLVEDWISENNWDIRLDLGRYPYPEHEPLAFWGDDTKLRQNLQST